MFLVMCFETDFLFEIYVIENYGGYFAVKKENVTVAFEPAMLSLCPLDVSLLIESDRFGKSAKTWEAGGVVDLTEISENSLNSSIASGCLALAGLRQDTVNLKSICSQMICSIILLRFSRAGMALYWQFRSRKLHLGCYRE